MCVETKPIASPSSSILEMAEWRDIYTPTKETSRCSSGQIDRMNRSYYAKELLYGWLPGLEPDQLIRPRFLWHDRFILDPSFFVLPWPPTDSVLSSWHWPNESVKLETSSRVSRSRTLCFSYCWSPIELVLVCLTEWIGQMHRSLTLFWLRFLVCLFLLDHFNGFHYILGTYKYL